MQNEIDKLVFDLVLTQNLEGKEAVLAKIWSMAAEKGVYAASINELYKARGRGEMKGFTVPAMNIRVLTYDLVRAAVRAAMRNNAGAFIFEIAKSEIAYTDQRPAEYTGVCLAAAMRENYKGPIFIQGDHFQVNVKKYKQDAAKEIQGIKDLISEAVRSGFYNIDIDSSTLVDLSKPNIEEQQFLNSKACAEITNYIRSVQPKGITISVGGEIGEVGGKNSTPDELEAFVNGYKKLLTVASEGISKISVQTGTSHGGVVLPDGTIAKVKLDFDTLGKLSKLARDKYAMAGAVQHGASTLPADAFGKFPEVETAEVHLATEFQNMVYDSKSFPEDMRDMIYKWLDAECASEKEDGQTREQFIYKARKKALGPFKKDIMNLPEKTRDNIGAELEAKFEFLFKKLNITGTSELVKKYVKHKPTVFDRKKSVSAAAVDSEGAD